MMEKLMARGEQLAKEAQQRRVREMASFIAERLPQAEIKELLSGISIRDVRLFGRWLDEMELRFLGSMRQ
jgi:hypothetical protein